MYLAAGWCIMDGMHSGEPWRLGRRPGLDGLRGVAVLFVIAAHFGIRNLNSTSAGTTGVTVFFTLSGFLITALLLQEQTDRGGIRRGAFYLRRARRLVPALLVCVALAVVLELVILGRIVDPGMIISTLTYTSNFLMAGNHFGTTFLGHTWSLAIEEQFYLLWPFALLFLVRMPRSRAMLILGYAEMVGVVLRQLMWNGGDGQLRIWMGTATRSDALLIGCLLAFLLHGQTARAGSRCWGVGGALVLASLLPWRWTLDSHATGVTTPLLAALAAAAIIYSSVTRDAGRVLGSRVLRYVGSRSYGLYLYHVPIVTALRQGSDHSMTTIWLIAGPASLLVAELSYRYVEQPFLRRRSVQVEDARQFALGVVAGEGAASGLEEEHGHRVRGARSEVPVPE